MRRQGLRASPSRSVTHLVGYAHGTMDTGEGRAAGGVHNEFHGVADFVVMARDISGPVTYSPTFITASADPLDSATRELARMVDAQWRAEAGVRGLLDVSPLAIRWQGDAQSRSCRSARRVSSMT
ncbi:MAG: hypothetical protein ACRDRI_11535 [Pseudonocardiaceae bacterium]